jgi:hypothetical protein
MDFVQALATGPQVKWLMGTVNSIDGPTITVLVDGGLVPEVTPLDQYIPTVGDVVHMLSQEQNGIIALGSVPLAAPRPEPLPTGTEMIIDPSIIATHGPLPGQWELGTIVQAPQRTGCWFYNRQTLTPAVGMTLASFAIEVTLDSGSGPPEFMQHNTISPEGPVALLPSPSFGVRAGPVGVPTWLNLPLDWGRDLISGAATGVAVISNLFTGNYTSSTGRIRLTPV